VATKQSGLEPSGRQDLEHATRMGVQDKNQGRLRATRMHCEQRDKLHQYIIDKAVEEWRKRLLACVVAGGGQFEHRM